MTKFLQCNDLFPGCGFVAEAETDEDVLRACAAHAAEVHGMARIDEATAAKARGAIRDWSDRTWQWSEPAGTSEP